MKEDFQTSGDPRELFWDSGKSSEAGELFRWSGESFQRSGDPEGFLSSGDPAGLRISGESGGPGLRSSGDTGGTAFQCSGDKARAVFLSSGGPDFHDSGDVGGVFQEPDETEDFQDAVGTDGAGFQGPGDTEGIGFQGPGDKDGAGLDDFQGPEVAEGLDFQGRGEPGGPGFQEPGDTAGVGLRGSEVTAGNGFQSSGDSDGDGFLGSGEAVRAGFRDSGDAVRDGPQGSGDVARTGDSGDKVEGGAPVSAKGECFWGLELPRADLMDSGEAGAGFCSSGTMLAGSRHSGEETEAVFEVSAGRQGACSSGETTGPESSGSRAGGTDFCGSGDKLGPIFSVSMGTAGVGLTSAGSKAVLWCSGREGLFTASVSLLSWSFGLSLHFSEAACLAVM